MKRLLLRGLAGTGNERFAKEMQKLEGDRKQVKEIPEVKDNRRKQITANIQAGVTSHLPHPFGNHSK